ncbi:MAG: subclass B1 metallo-beta-lactamase [Bacteroidia bacterium]|nr:subclass B1 metallo-beta-lactamase [Bacteroidia bacterium]
MKNWIIVILVVIIHFNGFPQGNYQRIKVSNDIELVKLSKNAYVHISASEISGFGLVQSNGLIFVNGKEAFLFDTPVTDSQTKDLVDWIKDTLKLKIVRFAPNHWHSDCMGGLGYLQSQGIESYASQKTIEIARTKNLPVPAHGFKDSLQLHLGNELIKLYYLGAAHTLDNIVVWIPSEQILFAGCMVKSLNSKNLGNTADGDLITYPKTIDKLIRKFPTAKIVIPGHGEFGGIELIKHTGKLLTK